MNHHGCTAGEEAHTERQGEGAVLPEDRGYGEYQRTAAEQRQTDAGPIPSRGIGGGSDDTCWPCVAATGADRAHTSAGAGGRRRSDQSRTRWGDRWKTRSWPASGEPCLLTPIRRWCLRRRSRTGQPRPRGHCPLTLPRSPPAAAIRAPPARRGRYAAARRAPGPAAPPG
jgi:hypothetical protein